jgi:hypothetical protein
MILRSLIAAALLIPALAHGQNMAAMQGAADAVRAASTATPWYLSGGVAASNCVAAYAAKGAASQAASYDNLTGNASYDLVASTDPAWNTATGWTFSASEVLKTGITPTHDQTWSMIVKYAGASTSKNMCVAGSYSIGAGRFHVFSSALNFSYKRLLGNGNDSAYAYFGAAASSGVTCLAGTTAYHNGSSEGTITTGSAGSGVVNIAIGARQTSNAGAGTFDNKFDGVITSIAIYSATLTGAQVAAIGAAMP